MLEYFTEYLNLDAIFWNNTVHDYLLAFAVFFGCYLSIRVIKYVIVKKLKKICKKTKNTFDDFLVDLLSQINIVAFFIISIYIGLLTLNVPILLQKVVYSLFVITLTFQIIKIVQHIVDFAILKYAERAEKIDKDPIDETVVKFSVSVVNITLWTIGFLLILSNLGYNVSSLLAGLGIGGVAIALALQGVLGNLFNSLSILFDKPFKTGDFVDMGSDLAGTVKEVGLRSTRIKNLRGEEVIVPNSDVMASRIHNFKKMAKRRVVFNIGVTYDTPLKKLKAIPEIINTIILNQEDTSDKEGEYRTHFVQYGDSSLNFEILYHVTTNNYDRFLDTQQAINFEIAEVFEKEKIEMAFPTRTIYMKKG